MAGQRALMRPGPRHRWYLVPVLLAATVSGSHVNAAKNTIDDDLAPQSRRIGLDAPSAPAQGPLPGQQEPLALPSGNPLWSLPLETLQASRERPLFRSSRRPKAVIVAAPPPPVQKVVAPPPVEPETPTLKLIGLVAGLSEDRIAVFVANGTRDVIRLRVGEGHDGWILHSIGGREAVLEKGKRSVVLELPQLRGK